MLTSQESSQLIKYKIALERFEGSFNIIEELGYSDAIAKKLIIKPYAANTVNSVIQKTKILEAPPYLLSLEEINKIAAHHDGVKNLEAVQASYTALKDLRFSAEQVVKMVGHTDGSKNLVAVQDLYEGLRGLGIDNAKIVQIVNRNGGSKRLRASTSFMDALAGFGVVFDGDAKSLEENFIQVMAAQDASSMDERIPEISALSSSLFGLREHERPVTYPATKRTCV